MSTGKWEITFFFRVRNIRREKKKTWGKKKEGKLTHALDTAKRRRWRTITLQWHSLFPKRNNNNNNKTKLQKKNEEERSVFQRGRRNNDKTDADRSQLITTQRLLPSGTFSRFYGAVGCPARLFNRYSLRISIYTHACKKKRERLAEMNKPLLHPLAFVVCVEEGDSEEVAFFNGWICVCW